MIVFYDPNNNNQVMATYSGGTTSEVWDEAGYLKAEVPAGLEAEVSRDHQCTVASGVVTGLSPATNSVQAQPDARTVRISELNQKLQGDTITDGEVRELLKLERSTT